MSRRWPVLALVILCLVATSGCRPRTAGANPGGESIPRPSGNLPTSIAALGDSLSTGFGSCLLPASCERNSWSTGTGSQVDSHYRRLLSVGADIRDQTYNFAQPKARAADLASQAARAVEAEPQYVTLQIGANDACRPSIGDMTPVATFRAQVDDALRTIKRDLPRARVLVVSIPDIYRVWQLGHGRELVTDVWNGRICPSLLADPTSMTKAAKDRRAAFRARVNAYNKALAAACKAYGRHCRYDGGAAHRVRFGLNMLTAFDFFHPNAEGLNALAKATWPRSFTW
ncbi:SGNH/GDSL hydrolase family protein [Luedemannella helvata]|uniref:SGNH/GDSL hydrolase family protein n=1 Tax=Luedemannella helvata TaxID=349315 RepID=A0ABP4WZP8_9ACTN